MLAADTPPRFDLVPLRAEVAHTCEVGSTWFSSETRCGRRPETPLRAEGNEIGKGQNSPLSRAGKYWSALKFTRAD